MAFKDEQKYFDSAQDYRWEVVRASMELRKFMIRYDPIDSYDSSRRTLFKLFDLPPYSKDSFDDSDLMTAVRAGAAEAVWKWNQGREKDEYYGIRDFQGKKGIATFPGIIFDSLQDEMSINFLTNKLETTKGTAPGGQILITQNVIALNDSEKAIARQSALTPFPAIWDTLARESRIDSAFNAFNIDSLGNLDPQDVDFLRANTMYFGDSVSDVLQGMYGYNDSDWAHWMTFTVREDSVENDYLLDNTNNGLP